MKQTTTGFAAANIVAQGLEVNAEIALEDGQCVQGVDEDMLRLVEKHGLRALLAAVHDAAWTAGEVRDEDDFRSGGEDMGAFRTRIFSLRLGKAIDVLR
jgi:hypothetical protein